jgi:hypothetical protein
MGKNLQERNMHRKIRAFNKALEKDVFAGRFWIREYQKARTDGMSYFLYELRDREDPSRDYVIRGWFNEYEFWKVFEEMNEFIITSNFWEKYREGKRENQEN